MKRVPCIFVLLVLLEGCAAKDAEMASLAKTGLLGMSEADAQACLGAPDQRSTLDKTKILTYYSASTSNRGLTFNLPYSGTLNLGGGGYCHTTVRIDDNRVTSINYTGETDAGLAENAYCAPAVRTCVRNRLAAARQER